MSPQNRLSTTHTSTVTADQIDHLGHMNVRYYALNARAATSVVLAELGVEHPERAEVFDMYTRHHREQLVGTELEVRSGVVGVDAGSVRIYHELANSSTGDLAATFVYRARLDTPIDHVDTVVVPAHGAPRSIDLEATPTVPTLDKVRELGLAMRNERILDAADADGAATIPSHLLPMLIWGGTPLDGGEQQLLHVGPNGENMGWATMETRVGIDRLPVLGTRIQSFAATTAIADKTTQMTMWAFDVESGESLVSFEVVNLLFDIGARRAMSIPAEMRVQHDANLYPEFGPQRTAETETELDGGESDGVERRQRRSGRGAL